MNPSNLFALSLVPYLIFLGFLWRIPSAARSLKIGFTFLLVFVAVTIPAGIYAQTQAHTNLANLDWLHGSAEAFLTLTNLWILFGLKQTRHRDPPGGAGIMEKQSSGGAQQL
ncbi:MAG: DUF3593 domain-containing protein [Thermostichales cyanobacterium SZTDM-1c_bins_54]